MRKNMLIISSSVDLLINLLIKEEQLDTKNNEKLLCKLFGKNFFDVGNTLKELPTKELRDNKIYKIMGTDRTVISRLCSGKAKKFPQKTILYFENNFKEKGTQLCKGDIHINVVTNNDKSIYKYIDDYIEKFDKLSCKRERIKKTSKNEEDKKIENSKITKDILFLNKEINNTIKKYIKEYLKDNAYCKSEDGDENEEGLLMDNWLLKFMQKIFKELQKDGEKAEVIIMKLSELKKRDFDGWDPEQIENAAKKVYDLYIKLVALHTYKEWK